MIAAVYYELSPRCNNTTSEFSGDGHRRSTFFGFFVKSASGSRSRSYGRTRRAGRREWVRVKRIWTAKVEFIQFFIFLFRRFFPIRRISVLCAAVSVSGSVVPSLLPLVLRQPVTARSADVVIVVIVVCGMRSSENGQPVCV